MNMKIKNLPKNSNVVGELMTKQDLEIVLERDLKRLKVIHLMVQNRTLLEDHKTTCRNYLSRFKELPAEWIEETEKRKKIEKRLEGFYNSLIK